MVPQILIVTSSFALTCAYIISKFKHRADFYRFNVDFFYEYDISIENFSTTISSEHWCVKLDEIDSIYYRKISFPDFDGILDKKYHYFIYREIFAVVEGVIEIFEGVCLSKPSILRKADNKIYQLKVAQENGFEIPVLNIGNSGSSIQKFNEKYQSIVKPIAYGKVYNGKKTAVVQTNVVNKNIVFDTLKYCPSYFQEFVEKDVDVRVTIVGDKLFPVKIFSSNKVDWRKDYKSLRYELFVLPNELKEKCLCLMEALNLKFGAIDFVVKDDVYYFLEINANGQWAWLENELNLPISNEIIKILSSKKL